MVKKCNDQGKRVSWATIAQTLINDPEFQDLDLRPLSKDKLEKAYDNQRQRLNKNKSVLQVIALNVAS